MALTIAQREVIEIGNRWFDHGENEFLFKGWKLIFSKDGFSVNIETIKVFSYAIPLTDLNPILAPTILYLNHRLIN